MIAAIVTLLGGWRATAFALLAVIAGITGSVQTLRLHHEQDRYANHLKADAVADASAQLAARTAEYNLAVAVNHAAETYEKGKSDAQADADRVVADLRAGAIRLQDRWAGCEARRVSNAASIAGELDAAARDRAESASRIVRATADCDAQVRGLQEILIGERK